MRADLEFDQVFYGAASLVATWRHTQCRPAHVAAALIQLMRTDSPNSQEAASGLNATEEALRQHLDNMPRLRQEQGVSYPVSFKNSYGTDRLRHRAEGIALARGSTPSVRDIWLALLAEHDDGTLREAHDVARQVLKDLDELVSSMAVFWQRRYVGERPLPNQVFQGTLTDAFRFVKSHPDLGRWGCVIEEERMTIFTE